MRSVALISNQAFSLSNFRGPLIEAMTKMGVKVYALAPDFDDFHRREVRALGAEPVDISLSRVGVSPFAGVADLVRLAFVLRRIRPDITLSYFIKPVVYGLIAGRVARVPLQFALIEGMGHTLQIEPSSRRVGRRMLRTVVESMCRIALRNAERVFFLNADNSRAFLELGLVAQSQIVHLDGIGVDLALFAAAAPVIEPVTFMLAGRLLREKGIYDFIAAARVVKGQHPGVVFLLVGDVDKNPGSIKEREVREWVSEGLIEWPGQVSDVRPWLARASVFVLPSFYGEGLPRSTQEAMALGRPVITTNWVGCRDTVQDGITGFLVPPRDHASLAAAMLRFIRSPALIERMGREGRKLAEERFDVRRTNARILRTLGLLS